MSKKLLLFFAFILSVFCSFAYSFSAIGPGGQTLFYNIISAQVPGMPQYVAVTYPGTSADNPYSGFTKPTGNLVIPASVNYNGTNYTVTEIGERAFYGCTGLTGSPTLPNTLTQIKAYAFYGCTGFSGNLTLPNSVTNIGTYAFYNAGFTGTITFSNNITTIGTYAFAVGKFSGTLNLPTALTEVSNYAFAGCTRLTAVNFPANLTRIGNHAFDNCDGLTGALNIPDAVTTIGWRAFYDCDHITSVNTGNGVQYIYYGAFCHCGALNSLVIGDNVKRIYDFAFYGCNNLSTITIGNSLQYLDYSVFEGCTSLAAITMRRNTPPTLVTSATSYRPDPSQIITEDQGNYSGRYSECAEIINPNSTSAKRYVYYIYSRRHLYNESYPCPFSTGNADSTAIIYSSYKYTWHNSSNTVTYEKYINVYFYWHYISLYQTPGDINKYLNTFQGVNTSLVYLHVPCSSLQAYQNSSYWAGFIKQGYMSYLVQAQTADSVMGTAAVTQWPTCSNPQAIITATAEDGYHFNHWNDGDTNSTRTINMTQDTSLTAYFASDFVNVNLSSNNTVWGTTSGGGTYNYNTPITISASSNPHYHFVRWSDGNTENPRIVTPNQDLFLTAIFTTDSYQVNVLSEDSLKGSVSGSGSFNYYHATIISATPNSDYRFVRWSDGVTTNPRTVLVTQDTTLTAHFVSNWVMVNTSSNNDLWGEVSGGGSYYYQTTALVTATPREHYHFVCWNDSNTVNPRNIQVTEELSLTAIFQPNTHTLQAFANDANMGVVSGGGNYNYGGSTMLTATANEDYHFVGWADGNTDNPRNVTVLQDTTYIAVFASNWITISLSSNNDSYGSTFGSGQYYYNSTAVLMAMPSDHYHFVGWSDGDSENPRNITVVDNLSLTATFEPDMHTLSTQVSHAGRGTVVGEGEYAYGSEVILSAEANTGYYFSQWNDGNTSNPRTVSITRDTLFTAQFGTYSYTVLASANDPTGGIVTGGGTYDYGSEIILVANPNGDYHFVQWNDGNTDNPRIVTVTENAAYIATFLINHHTIDVINGSPTMGTTIGSGTYNHGDSAMLEANPFYGFHFSHWGDGDTTNPRTIVVSGDATYSAFFAPNRYEVTIGSSDTTMGAVSGGGEYDYDSDILIYATPNYGFHFTQWDDGNTANPREIEVTSDSSFTALFEANNYDVTVGSTDVNIGSTSGSGSYTYGSTATISAVPSYGYQFTQWNDGDTSNPRAITIVGDVIFLAQFIPNTYTVTVNSYNNNMGTASGSGEYNYDSDIMIYGTPNYGYHFTQWDDGNTDNPREIEVIRDTSFTAQFEANDYNVAVSSADVTMGSTLGGGTYTYGSTATISAVPSYGYQFTQWNDGSTSNPRAVTIVEDAIFLAQFIPNTYTVTVNSYNNYMGSASGGGEYDYDSDILIYATPNYGYHFTQWDDGSTDNPREIEITSDTSFTAQFEANNYDVTVGSADVTMGSTSGSGTYTYGDTVAISAVPSYGYQFTQWNDGNTSNPRTVTIVGDAFFWAQFIPNSYTVTVNSHNNDMGSASGGGEYDYDSEILIYATPNYGYHFEQWNDGNTANPRVIEVTGDISLTAQFAANNYIVTAGSVNVAMGSTSGSGTYAFSSEVTLSATPSYGYHFTNWTDGDTANPRIVTVTGDANYFAQFTPNNYTVTVASADETMGFASGSGDYSFGNSVLLSATASTGYHFTQWSDGNSYNPRLVTATRDTLFIAQFTPNNYTLSVSSADTTMGVTTGDGDFAFGSSTIISAVASYGYHFSHWSDGNTDNPRTLTITDNAVFIALFSPNNYSVIGYSNNSAMGIILGSGEYAFNSIAMLYAIPNNGYHFVQWDDGDTLPQKSIQITGNTSHQAFFEANSYNLCVYSTDSTQGMVTGSGIYDYGSSVMIYAMPTTHHSFVQWIDGVTDNPRLITVTHDMTIAAMFETDPQYVLFLSSSNPELGYVSGDGTYYFGEQVEIAAIANNNCSFSHWSDGVTVNPRIITITENISYVAYFEVDQYSVNVFSNDENMGTVTGGGIYEYGSTATIIATPTSGYHFEHWSDGVEDSVYIFIVTNDTNLTATFTPNVGVANHNEEKWYMFAANGIITIRDIPINVSVNVYDMLGKLIFHIDRSTEEELKVPVPTAGVYMVVVGNNSTKKIVVTN